MICFIVALFILLVLTSCKEKFVEMFGFSGYKKPVLNLDLNYADVDFDLTGFSKVTGELTPDELDAMISATQKFISRTGKVCAYPIETSSVERYVNSSTGDKLSKCRFMFVTTNTNFPFGFGLTSVILNGKVVATRTQVLKDTDSIKPHEEETASAFLPFSDLVAKPDKGILNK